jgi:hypothetical protein
MTRNNTPRVTRTLFIRSPKKGVSGQFTDRIRPGLDGSQDAVRFIT